MNLVFLNAVNKTEIFLPNEFQRLLETFKSSENIWKSTDRTLFRKAEISEEKTERFFTARVSIDPEKEWTLVEEKNLLVAVNPNLWQFLHDRGKNAEGWDGEFSYPQELLTLTDPPPILYMKGVLPQDTPKVAVVGTRKFSLYGKQIASELSAELSNAGVTIISGLARGIDSFAHGACVERNNQTIAVLGSGIDDASIYPAENRNLAQRIVEAGGAVLSEFSPGAEAYPSHFPQRNRIVSGLSLGVIVIEAPLKSGALITARLALEQGKEVFSIPGPINSINSEGTNYLIKNGAHPVTCVEDILEILDISTKKQKDIKTNHENLSEKEQNILEMIGREALHVDTITEKTGLSVSVINSTLTMLEIKEMIKHTGNNYYAKA